MDQYLLDIAQNVQQNVILILRLDSSVLNDVFRFEEAMRILPIQWRPKVTSKKKECDIQKALCNKLLQLFGCSSMSHTPARSLVFGSTNNGKPTLPNNRNIVFSMSNGEEYVVMYIQRGISGHILDDIGIDIASVEDLRSPSELGTLKDIFNQKEMDTLRNTPPHRLTEMFAYYWSFKESYTKYTGTGISCDLTAINAGQLRSFDGDQTIARQVEENDMCFTSWWLNKPHKEIVTVCSLEPVVPLEPRVYEISIDELLHFFQS